MANEDGAGDRKQTFLQVLSDRIVRVRPAQPTKLLAALLWSENAPSRLIPTTQNH